MKWFIVLILLYTVFAKDFHFHDGKFRIMQVTDTHYGDYDTEDDSTTKLVEDLLELEKPDLVVITGDLVSGYKYNGTQGWYKHYWEKATKSYIKYGIPYALVLGNHDSEGDLDRKQVMKLDITNPMSVSQVSPEELPGGSNYYFPLYGSNNSTKVEVMLWFFDSMYKYCGGIEGYGCVETETVNWYYSKSKQIEKELGKKGALAFMHIPPQEMMTAWNEKHEVNSCSAANSGLVTAMLNRKDISGVFFGHDHRNNYDININGLHLVYGLKTGFGAYDPLPWKERGVRMIELQEGVSTYTSYLRTLSHKIIIQENMHWTNGTQYHCNM
ncbi:hypothetical protein WA158_005615 [Blastocystis sp. Blastoise]